MKTSPIAPKTSEMGLSWLSDVRESAQPLTEHAPIWVRHGVVRAGPMVPHPERHPYCEFGTLTAGSGIEFVEREQGPRRAGDIFFAGPGVPHWIQVTDYPVGFVTVHFLPSLLIEMGPEGDGVALMHRFSALQPLSNRLIHPAPALRKSLAHGFEQLVAEFESKRFGREMRLRSIFFDMLVNLFRSKEVAPLSNLPAESAVEWEQVNRALRHLQSNYDRPIYGRDVSAAAGVSESKLKSLFRQTVGMTWVHYLQSYRIHRAVAQLGDPRRSVTEVALDVGFESLSHFNSTFRAFMGMSPIAYVQRASKRNKPSAKD